jgi:YVTN family beta-propeller protein
LSFTLYPEPAVRALAVPAGATVFTPFAQRSARVPKFDPPYAQIMFLRIAMLRGTSAPKLLLAVGDGTPVEVSVDPQGVFASPGDVHYVGDVSLTSLGDNIFAILIGLVSAEPALTWRLGIRNTDATKSFFTWVVADSEADTEQNWVDPDAAGVPVTTSILLPGTLTHIALEPGAQTAYLCKFSGSAVAVIDVPGRAVIATIPVGQHPSYIALDPGSHTAYVANSFDSTISVIDTASRAVTATIGNTRLVTNLAIDSAKGVLYAGCGDSDSGQIALIDIQTHTVIDYVPLAHRPFDLALDPTTHTLYATNNEDNALIAVDPDTRAQTSITPVSKRAFGVVVDPISHVVYVSCPNENTLVMIDPGTHAMTTIPVAQRPKLLAIDPGAYTVFIANVGEDTISEIDTRTGDLSAVRVGRPRSVAVDATSHIAVSPTYSPPKSYVTIIERRHTP